MRFVVELVNPSVSDIKMKLERL